MDKFFVNIKIRSLIAIYFGILLLLAVISELQFVKATNILDDNMALLLCNLTIVLWILFRMIKSKFNIKEKIADLRNDLKIKDIILSFFINIALTIGIFGTVVYITATLWPSAMSNLFNEINGTEVYTAYSTIVYTISAAFVAPFAEEFMFRGVILNRLKIKFGVKKAIIISSILFGLMHFELAILPGIVFGICMAVVYLKTKNIFVPIAIHLINNLIASLGQIISFFMSSEGTSQASNITINDVNFIWLIVGIIALIAAIVMSYYFFKINKSEISANI